MLKFVLTNERESKFPNIFTGKNLQTIQKKNSRADLIRRRPDVVCYT